MKVQLFTCKLVKEGAPKTVSTEYVKSGEHSVAALRTFMDGLPHEEVWILLLARNLKLRGAVRVSMGGVSACAIRPIDVLRPVVASGFDTFVLGHNHPSGDPSPSYEDRVMTREVLKACNLLGLHLLDHIIVTSGPDWVSMSQTTSLWEDCSDARNCES